MKEYQLLKEIFTDFKVKEKVIPTAYIKYKGKSKTYITYTFTDDDPLLFAEDKELGSAVYVDIDIYSDGNYLEIEEKIKDEMEKNNFIRTGGSEDMYEEDTELYHKTLEYSKERMRNNG